MCTYVIIVIIATQRNNKRSVNFISSRSLIYDTVWLIGYPIVQFF